MWYIYKYRVPDWYVGRYILENYSAIKRMESCYLKQHLQLQSHYTKWSKSEKENMHSIYAWNYLKETHPKSSS